jgi:hypothetical protein
MENPTDGWVESTKFDVLDSLLVEISKASLPPDDVVQDSESQPEQASESWPVHSGVSKEEILHDWNMVSLDESR